MIWMQTHGSNVATWPPKPEHFTLGMVAHSLAHKCRYNGHTSRYYSVAEHCVLLCRWFQDAGHSSVIQRQALMHELDEVHGPDFTRPWLQMLKEAEPAAYAVIMRVRAAWAEAGMEYFDIGPIQQEVREADSRILLDERNALMRPWPQDWGISGEPLGVQIFGWTPLYAKVQFLREAARLGINETDRDPT